MTEQANFFDGYKIKLIHKIIEDFFEFGDTNSANAILDTIFTITDFDPFTKKIEGSENKLSEVKND